MGHSNSIFVNKSTDGSSLDGGDPDAILTILILERTDERWQQ